MFTKHEIKINGLRLIKVTATLMIMVNENIFN